MGELTDRNDIDEALLELGANGLVTFSEGFLSLTCRQRVMLAEALIHSGADARRVSRFLRWQEFEDFAEDILSENGFSTRKHFIFKSSLGRREIDILAWNDTFVLAVDCKHWVRGLSTGRMKEAARAQMERSAALARRPELLDRLRVRHAYRRSITPVILALGDPQDQLIDGVPVVSVSRLMSFIYGVSPIDTRIKQVKINSGSQSHIA
jgi:Holliday junction resolvase-like predicted endonuclease